MQTFLPYPDFQKSAFCLDRLRLGKQRVEAWQILNILNGESKSNGWRNHPAVLMWKGHEKSLALYGISISQEWRSRGYKDVMLDRFSEYILKNKFEAGIDYYPTWFGDLRFHTAHRSNLLRKNPDHYKKFGWTEPDSLEYVWPVTIKKELVK
jgi:hypothetical protein